MKWYFSPGERFFDSSMEWMPLVGNDRLSIGYYNKDDDISKNRSQEEDPEEQSVNHCSHHVPLHYHLLPLPEGREFRTIVL